VATSPAAYEVRWSLRTPAWVQALAIAFTLLIAAALAAVLFWTELLAAELLPWAALTGGEVCLAVCLILYARRHHHHVLCAAPGLWRVLDGNDHIRLTQALVLHRWAGPGWLTLRLQGQTARHQQQGMHVVIWQSSVAPQDWRLLQKWSLRTAARVALAGAAA